MENKFSACEVLEMAICIEENGRDFYAAFSGMSDSQELKKVFDYLSEAEKDHIEVFRKISNDKCYYEPKEIYPEEYFSYMKALASQFIFTRKNTGKETAGKIRDVSGGIELAIGLEKDSVLFYEEVKKYVPDKTKDIIDRIIREEKTHVSRLSGLFTSWGEKTKE